MDPKLATSPRRAHALSPNSAFTLPPLDGSLTLTELYDYHYKHNPNHAVFVHQNGSAEDTKLSYSDVVPAIHQAARWAAGLTNVNLDAKPEALPTIAVLASSDTITYITSVLGILRAGFAAFLIAPRCSVPAVAALLLKTKPTHVLISKEASIRELAEAGIAQFKSDNPDLAAPAMHQMPAIEEIYCKDVPFVPVAPVKRDFSAPRLILHSSGSTSLPKPIIWNDRVYLQIMMQSHFATQDMCGQIYAAHGLAMFHSVAWAFVSWIPATGLTLATFEPASPATVPSPEAVFRGIVQSSATWAFAVPSFIEQWAVDESKFKHLQRLNGLAFGGGPLNKHVGDLIVKNGVKLHMIYGTTEVGAVAIPFYDCQGTDWDYFAIDPDLGADFIPIGDGTFELVIVAKPDREITVINAKFEGKDAYSISDLLVAHPTKKGMWRIIGRTDDQITLSTGEKTNPAPLESILSQDSRVASAVMFGRGRFQVGVLVELKPEFAFDPSDEEKLVELRNHLWPKVEEMNAIAPTHSRLFKEMILVTTPSKPITYTGKGTVRKAKAIEDYDPEIEALYNTLEQMTQVDPPGEWTAETSLKLVEGVVENILQRKINNTEDLFEAGCDSLQATWIRNSFMHALRKTPDISMEKVSPGFIYENPTISTLARYLLTIVHGGESVSHGTEELVAYVEKYASAFPKHVPSSSTVEGEVVFVTGTTGSLGSAVLAQLVAKPSVKKVYAFNRPSSTPIAVRQKEALKSRGYDPEIAQSSKVVLVEGKLTGAGIGLDQVLEDEIRRNVTHIVHTAWRVDFNLSLPSFEGAIAGIRTLVDFALSSPQPTPPRLLFTSSVGALRNINPAHPVEESLIEDPAVPLGMGYGESKWIAERILDAAAKATPLQPTVLRIGQISGGKNGSWNTSDWLPAIVKSSLTLGSLPEFKGASSWIPLDLAAETIVELRNEGALAVNLVHPQPVACKQLFEIFSQELSLPLVPYAQWVTKLEKAAAEASQLNNSSRIAEFADKLRAATLFEFFQGALKAEEFVQDDSEALGFPRLVTDNAHKASASFRDAGKLGTADVRSWLTYWRESGFLA